MPAVAISWKHIQADVSELAQALAGVNPASPAPSMGDIPLPVYRLGYSVFVQNLSLLQNVNVVYLTTTMVANVHPIHQPSQVIRSYVIQTTQPSPLTINYNQQSTEIYWEPNGGTTPTITPSWGANYKNILAGTSVPAPQDSNYLQSVEQQIIWLTGPSFINLVTGALPTYNLNEIVPWLKFSPPLRLDFSSQDRIIITSQYATITSGDCSPKTITLSPDPNFPYGQPIPSAKLQFECGRRRLRSQNPARDLLLRPIGAGHHGVGFWRGTHKVEHCR